MTWWDEEFDVVVMGAGAAGLMAAVEAAERGASVLLVEKQPAPGGGATGMSVGSITAAGTDLQKAAGIQDDVDAHYQTVVEMAAMYPQWKWDLEMSRLMCETSPAAVARLVELGVQFSGPHPEVPHPVYRMHNGLPGSEAYIEALTRAAGEREVQIRVETTVDEFERDEDGAVTMVAVRGVRSAQTRAIKVRRGLVLAAGDFSASVELGQRYGRPPEVEAMAPIQPNATGDGHLLGLNAGAAAEAMERTGFPNFRTVLAPYVQPDPSLFAAGAILVNLNGERFADETGRPEFATALQPRQMAFLVFDSLVGERVAVGAEDSPGARDGWAKNGKLFLSTFPGVAYAYLEDFRARTEYLFDGATAGELASATGLPAAQLEATLDAYSQAAATKGPDSLGRKELGGGVSKPPFHAIGPIHPIRVFSGGGLVVDKAMRVLDTDRRPIGNLYACGANAEAAPFLGGHGHHLAWAFGTGMIAGRNAACGPAA